MPHARRYAFPFPSVSSKTGLAVGLMVTASHNAEPDNGIKMVDPNGGMLSQDWEGYAEVRARSRTCGASYVVSTSCPIYKRLLSPPGTPPPLNLSLKPPVL